MMDVDKYAFSCEGEVSGLQDLLRGTPVSEDKRKYGVSIVGKSIRSGELANYNDNLEGRSIANNPVFKAFTLSSRFMIRGPILEGSL